MPLEHFHLSEKKFPGFQCSPMSRWSSTFLPWTAPERNCPPSSYFPCFLQVPSETGNMCYGPAVPEGYGFCYNPKDGCINFVFSAWNSCGETSCCRLADSMRQALIDGRDTMMQDKETKMWSYPFLSLWSPILIPTHLKLWIASAIHNFKWLEIIQIFHLGGHSFLRLAVPDHMLYT